MTDELPGLSTAEHNVLCVLDSLRRWAYGLEIVKASEGKVKRSAVYVQLSSLGDKGYVEWREETEEEHDPRIGDVKRRLYRVTNKGKRALLDHEVKQVSWLDSLGLLKPT